MRRLAQLAVLLSCAVPAAALDRLPVANGDFSKPVKKAGDSWSLEGQVRRVEAEAPFGRALELEPGALLRVAVPLPAPPVKKDVDTEGWYAVASIDLLGTVGGEDSELVFSIINARGERSSMRTKRRVEGTLPEVPAASPGVPEPVATTPRLWLRLPTEELAARAGGELVLELAVTGDAAVVVDDLRVERFHERPQRSLLGKANGKNGPDLLGAGMLGFTGLTEHMSTSFSILDVREEGPAARAGLVAGDLVVSVDGVPLPTSRITPGWEWFHRSNEAVLGRAIQAALEEGRKRVTLVVLRERGRKQLTLKLPIRGAVDDDFPLRGKHGEALRADLLAWTVGHQKDNGGWPGTDAVNPAMGGLALLGTRDSRHASRIRRCVDYLLQRNPRPSEMKGLAYWTVAFQGIFFAEYYLASGDERVLEWMREASAWLPGTTHESKWGMQAFGHGPDGLPYDSKSLMAPTAHLLVYDALARQCGVESRIWEHVREYVVHSWSDPASEGHGGMGYNASYKDKGEFWSRSGLTALAAALRGENGAMRQGLCLFMQERHPWMLNSHAYGEPGAALGLLSLAVAHPPAFEEVLPHWRWRFLNAWEPGYGLRYSTPHMGAPYMGAESIVNLSYAVLSAVENGGLVVAGGDPLRWLK